MCANMIVYIPSSPNAVRESYPTLTLEWRRSLRSQTAATAEICRALPLVRSDGCHGQMMRKSVLPS